MFWIYGGGFISGAGVFSLYDPTAFLEEGVIVVTSNYRLGILGFLSTGDEVLSGNAGLKDQLAALTWTKNNIAAFGGNPEDITVFGESAGAMSTGYLLASPKSKDLFSAAIMESGTSLKFTLQTQQRNNAVEIATQLNSSIYTNSPSSEILQVLQTADINVLLNISGSGGMVGVGSNKFLPGLEEANPAALVSEPFYETMESGNFMKVPIIIGTNSEEQIGFISDIAAARELAAQYDLNQSLLLPEVMLKEGVDVSVVTSEIKRFYTNNGSFADNPAIIINLLTDDSFRRPAIKHALLQSSFSPVFLYQFSFVGTISKNHLDIPGCGRVAHGDEVPYLFNTSQPIATDADFILRKKFVKLWTNFAKTKNPTPPNDDSGLLGDLIWSQLDPASLNYLDIDEELIVKENLRAEQTAFWDHVWNTYAARPYNTF